MSESLSHNPFSEEQKREALVRYLRLAETLSQLPDGLPFPGVDEETLRMLKEEEEKYPEYATPIDELIARMEKEGIKIVFGTHPDSGNVFVLPKESTNIDKDSVFPRHLKTTTDMDESLRSLILTNKTFLNTEIEEVE